jgi:hypothetical protein
MRKIYIIILAFFIITCCVRDNWVKNDNMYNDLLNKQLNMMPKELIKKLKKQKVIIIGEPLIVDEVTTIDGQEVSKVVISKKLIPDPEKRYFISHLIRNILIEFAMNYNYYEYGTDLFAYSSVKVSNDFIITNKEMICDVIYYLLHKDYFNLYGKLGSSGEEFFSSPLLASIKNEISQLKTRLLKENALIMISVPVHE